MPLPRALPRPGRGLFAAVLCHSPAGRSCAEEWLEQLSISVAAFHTDLQGFFDRVTVVVQSEFGRRVAENSSLGTDHGHGNCMFLMGGHVAGGQVYTAWPGLQPEQLDDGDLAITTDYRDVLSEILQLRMGSTDLATVFPNHTPSFPGLIS